MVSVVLADDHAVVRQGLRSLLESDPQFKVVGEAADGREAIDMVMRKKPAVLIADLIMPKSNGLEVARQLSRRKSATRVLLLSMYPDEAYVLEALRNGAAGYLAKESSGTELFHAMKEILAGRRYLSPSISEASRNSFAAQGTILEKAGGGASHRFVTLTARERTVLRLLVEGTTHREIGDRLRLDARAVEVHQAAIMRKLGVTTRSALIRSALRRGVVDGHASTPTRKPVPRKDTHGGQIKGKTAGAREAPDGNRRAG